MNEQDEIRGQIYSLISRFAETQYRPEAFQPGITPVPASGKVIGANELITMVEACLDGWLTTGRFNEAFEQKLASYIGIEHLLTTNSGSSANLLALAALTSPTLGDRSLKPGDEVITVAAGFPTTVNPALLYGLVPVFVDISIPTYNIDTRLIEAAITDKTRVIMLAHTLGNPFNLNEVKRLAELHNLWLIEDCCDALGSQFEGQHVGTFGDIGTVSFYPAHHITMGEGGAVFTRSPQLKTLLESFRDWGRDCYCEPGCDNTCGRRFSQQMGSLPYGYDHKYTYSHAGFNLKISDMQAACGLAQLARLDEFVTQRKENFRFLNEALECLDEFIIRPEATVSSEPSWFGYPVTIRKSAGVNRRDLVKFFDQNRIGTRLLFGGNLTRQPYFEGRTFRIPGSLENTDTVMNQTFWLGVYPGLTEDHLAYTASKFANFFGLNF